MVKKRIFIYGGSGGLGMVLCNKFMEKGFEVFFSARSQKKINFVKKN
jgi:short-subunit dehydrogenase